MAEAGDEDALRAAGLSHRSLWGISWEKSAHNPTARQTLNEAENLMNCTSRGR